MASVCWGMGGPGFVGEQVGLGLFGNGRARVCWEMAGPRFIGAWASQGLLGVGGKGVVEEMGGARFALAWVGQSSLARVCWARVGQDLLGNGLASICWTVDAAQRSVLGTPPLPCARATRFWYRFVSQLSATQATHFWYRVCVYSYVTVVRRVAFLSRELVGKGLLGNGWATVCWGMGGPQFARKWVGQGLFGNGWGQCLLGNRWGQCSLGNGRARGLLDHW